MSTQDLIVLVAAVGLVLLIYLIRYIIAKIIYKGTDAIENKLRQIEPGTRATGSQSLAQRLGVSGQNPPNVQPGQTPPPQPQPGNPSVSAQGQRASFCEVCGAPVEPGSSFCSQCGAKVQ